MDRMALVSCFEDTYKRSKKGSLSELTAQSMTASKVYSEGFVSHFKKDKSESALVKVETITSFAAAKKYLHHGKVAVLNFANPEYPGGGVKNGAMAQEECLCRSSNLYSCLESAGVFRDFYGYHRDGKSHYFSDRLIYTPAVTVFKTDEEYPKLMSRQEWFYVDVITCAAPYLEKGRYVNPEFLLRLFRRRIKNILEAACDNDVDVLILGAFGCGAFHNPPKIVAQAFSQAIFDEDYHKKFSHIIFAIKPTGELCPNVGEFMWQFPDYNPEYCTPLPETPEMRFGRKSSLVKDDDNGTNRAFWEWQDTNQFFGKQFSVLGDSISTLEGYNPNGYRVFYDEQTGRKAGVRKPEDTWWDQVISFFGGELLINNSWSGSRVTMLPSGNYDRLFPSACSEERTSTLHQSDVKPDVIIVNMGVNDWANGVTIRWDDCCTINEYYASYEAAYAHMLQEIRRNYPDSEIWCCTLCETFIPDKPDFQFPHEYAGIHIEQYNDSIRKLALENQCRLVDIYQHHMPYASMDGTHPTKEGMETIATLIIQEVCGAEVQKMIKDHSVIGEMEDQAEYVDLKPDATTELFTDTIELFRESTGEKITVQGTILKLGRNGSCDIIVDHPLVSRHHATFFFHDGIWYVRDERSTNKTRLNDVTIEPGKMYQLHVGDVVAFGCENYTFFKLRMYSDSIEFPAAAALGILDSSIKEFAASDFQDEKAFRLIMAALSEVPLYMPVQIDISAMFGALDLKTLKPGDTIRPEEDVRTKVLTLNLANGDEIVPLFTSAEEANKGGGVSTIRYYPSSYLPILIKMGKNAVINPFSEHKFVLTFAMIQDILKPMVDHKELNPITVPPMPVLKTAAPAGSEEAGTPQPIKKDTQNSLIGKMIDGKYKILGEIGRGGSFSVYLGIHEKQNMCWAIKAIDKTAPGMEHLREVILQEPKMMMQFDHPAIPKVVDLVEDEQYIYIVRECIEGRTLSFVLRENGTVSEQTAVEWAIQLCEVLQYLHTHNPPYIYRDMKPANVMLQPNGKIKLIDFSIAMVYDASKPDKWVLGTRGYAPPEQYIGRTDFRSDIFALGMTLHHMLTGEDPCVPPYEAKPIRSIKPELSPALEEIVNRCIQPNPDHRFQSCEELLTALRGEPIYPKKKRGFLEKLFGNKHSKQKSDSC